MGNSHKNHLVWNQQLNQNQTLMEQSFDGSLPKLCPAVVLSHQDGCRSAVALLLKAALIQVSDYRLLGASGFLSWFPDYYKRVPVCLGRQRVTPLSIESYLTPHIMSPHVSRCDKLYRDPLLMLMYQLYARRKHPNQ